MAKGKLTRKQFLFVHEYLKDMNATQAAIRAGYSKHSAFSIGIENLKKHLIAEELSKAFAARAGRLRIDADYVLNQAVKLHERCMQEVRPKMIRVDGKSVHAEDEDGNLMFLFDTAGAAKALELIGKHVGVQAFKDRLDLNATIAINIVPEDADL